MIVDTPDGKRLEIRHAETCPCSTGYVENGCNCDFGRRLADALGVPYGLPRQELIAEQSKREPYFEINWNPLHTAAQSGMRALNLIGLTVTWHPVAKTWCFHLWLLLFVIRIGYVYTE